MRPASTSWRSWGHYFKLAHWARRGAGRTFAKSGPDGPGLVSFEQFVSDGLEVTEFVRGQLGPRELRLYVRPGVSLRARISTTSDEICFCRRV